MEPPDISVIILTYNARDLLIDCIDSVIKASIGLQVEIIVSDNGSTDGTQEAIRKRFPQVILVENNANFGYSGGNNRGIEVSQGRYVLILNPDTIVDKEALKLTYDYAEKHPECGVIGCRVYYPNGTIQTSWFAALSLFHCFFIGSGLQKVIPFNRFDGKVKFSSRAPDKVVKVDRVLGCFLWIPRKVIDKVGMFDEEFFIYCEEDDLCQRIRDAGWEVHYYPEPIITHFEGQGGTKHISERAKINSNTNKVRFLKKHRPAWEVAVFRIIWSVFLLIRVVVRGLMGIFRKYHREVARGEWKSVGEIWKV